MFSSWLSWFQGPTPPLFPSGEDIVATTKTNVRQNASDLSGGCLLLIVILSATIINNIIKFI